MDYCLPKISIITPSLNQGKYLEKTICSVLAQNYPCLEYIIVDGGSTDDSIDIIKRYEANITYWISEPDNGQSHALNKGFQRSSGDWITWLNADDYYLPNALMFLNECVQNNPQVDWIIGNTIVVDEHGKFNERLVPNCQHNAEWYTYVATRRFDTLLPQPSSFFSKNAWKTVGLFDESLCYAMDFDYWGRLAISGYRPYIIAQDLVCFRVHTDSKTSKGPLPFRREEVQVVNKWLEKLNGHERSILKSYNRSLVYGCFKLKLVSILSLIFGNTVVDRLVNWLYKLKGGK